MNKFQFMGRLTRDPESRFTQNTNTPVTTFSIAVNRRFAEANGEGRIQNRTWEDQSGQKRYATDYIIENAYFADSRRDADMSNAGMANNASTPASTDDGEFITIDDTDELPF